MALALFVAAESLALERAAAQVAPAPAPVTPAPAAPLPSSYVAHNAAVKPSRPPQTPISQTNAAKQPDQTKVVRIYGGAGYFDNALAEKLRPMLAKAFPSSKPDAPKAVPGAAVAAPAKGESQGKLTLAAHR
jgi:hypothetical protein